MALAFRSLTPASIKHPSLTIARIDESIVQGLSVPFYYLTMGAPGKNTPTRWVTMPGARG